MGRGSRASRGAALVAMGLALGSLASGCGSRSVSAGTGSVALLLTDAPSDEFTRIELVVTRVELLGDSRVEIFSGRETVDLLALASFSNPLFVATEVPVGAYQKVRLTIDDVALVREVPGDGGATVVETLHPELPGGGVVDLVPRRAFFVVPGDTLVMEIDVDAAKAIHAIPRGRSAYGVRPVAFVRVLGEERKRPKPARLHGRIRAFLGPHAFALCSDEIRATRGGAGTRSTPSCLAVNLAESTRVFDAPGERVGIEELALGAEVTVVGELRLRRGGASLGTIPGRASEGAPFALRGLDGADIQLDAFAVALGPRGTSVPEPVAAAADPRRGVLASLDPEGRRFELVLGVESECVEIASDALLLLLADDGQVASAIEISLDDLVAGQWVEVFGAPAGECFGAEAVVAAAAGRRGVRMQGNL